MKMIVERTLEGRMRLTRRHALSAALLAGIGSIVAALPMPAAAQSYFAKTTVLVTKDHPLVIDNPLRPTDLAFDKIIIEPGGRVVIRSPLYLRLNAIELRNEGPGTPAGEAGAPEPGIVPEGCHIYALGRTAPADGAGPGRNGRNGTDAPPVEIYARELKGGALCVTSMGGNGQPGGPGTSTEAGGSGGNGGDGSTVAVGIETLAEGSSVYFVPAIASGGPPGLDAGAGTGTAGHPGKAGKLDRK